jgi:hypothetical protein
MLAEGWRVVDGCYNRLLFTVSLLESFASIQSTAGLGPTFS